MECEIANCKCVCHIYNPQQPNIKELLIKELEKEMMGDVSDSNNASSTGSASGSNTASSTTTSRTDNVQTSYFSDQDDLWERRRRLHAGEEKPLSHEQYKAQLPSAQDIKRIYGVDIPTQKSAELIKPAEPTKVAECPSLATKEAPNLIASELKSDPTPNASIPKPTPLNPLHKYRVKERDQIIRTIYQRAVNETKYKYKNLDSNSKEFHEYVNKEADRQLEIWLQSNK